MNSPDNERKTLNIDSSENPGISADENESLYSSLFTRYYRVLTAFAWKFLGDREMSKDIVQEIFVKLYSKKISLDTIGNIKSYLFRSVANECINQLKKETVRHKHHEHYARELSEIVFQEKIHESE